MYQQQTRSYPPSPLPPARLKQTVEVAKQIEANARLPDQVFGVVSRALDVNPEIGLTGLTWRNGRQGAASAPPGQLVQSAQLQLQLMAKPSDQKAVLATINKFVQGPGRERAGRLGAHGQAAGEPRFQRQADRQHREPAARAAAARALRGRAGAQVGGIAA